MSINDSIQNVWKKVRKKYFYPVIGDPIVATQTPSGKEVKTAMMSFADGRKVFVNPDFYEHVKNLGMDGDDALESMLDHEVAHNSYCPRDFGAELDILYEIDKVIDDKKKVGNIMQFYFDAIVNTHNVVEKETKIPEFYKTILSQVKDNKDDMNVLMGMMYQHKWNRDIGLKSLDDMESGIRKRRSGIDDKKSTTDVNDPQYASILEEIKLAEEELVSDVKFVNAVKEIDSIDYLDKKNWGSNSRLFAKAVADYVTDEPMNGSDGLDQFSEEEVEQGLREFAQKSGPKDFERIVDLLKDISEDEGSEQIMMGLGQGNLEFTNEDFYKMKAQKYSLPVENMKLEKSGSMFPNTLSQWDISDPANDIDFWNSYGKIMPGITQKRNRIEGETHGWEEKTPDCLIIVDSSGSMTKPSSQTSNAAIGAGAAADAYLKRDAQVAVYNFADASSGSEYIVDFTRDRDEIYRGICAYFEGGTKISSQTIDDILKEKENIDIFLISDMEITNRRPLMEQLASYNGRVTAVYVRDGQGAEDFVTGMRDSDNVTTYGVGREQDIAKIIIGKIKKDFGLDRI